MSNSRSVRRRPASSSQVTSFETRSSLGCLRRSAAMRWPYSKSSSAVGLRKGSSRYSALSGLPG